jgi:hypothetical protein
VSAVVGCRMLFKRQTCLLRLHPRFIRYSL